MPFVKTAKFPIVYKIPYYQHAITDYHHDLIQFTKKYWV